MKDLKTITKELRTIHAHIAAAGLLGEASSYPVVKMIVSKLKEPCKEMAGILDEMDALESETGCQHKWQSWTDLTGCFDQCEWCNAIRKR